MALFQKAENQQAYLKAGFMGFAGSGKTYTATKTAIGIVGHMRAHDLQVGSKPVYFLDTETGSDWVRPEFDAAGIDLYTAKTRSFADLLTAMHEAEQNASAMLIDSISHFWRELTESYAKKRNRTRGLEFQDWAFLKHEWGKFTDAYINSALHVLMCGRAGYEYDFFEDESGKKQLEKTGVKMRAETETGYEPSLLVLMERHMDMETKTVYREAHVLKDRARLLDGKTFKNPTCKDFMPHINFLNLGGTQVGVDTSRNSEDTIPEDGKGEWVKERERREILLEKIQAAFVQADLSSQSKDGKRRILELLKKHFGTVAWKELEGFKAQFLADGLEKLERELFPPAQSPAAGSPPSSSGGEATGQSKPEGAAQASTDAEDAQLNAALTASLKAGEKRAAEKAAV